MALLTSYSLPFEVSHAALPVIAGKRDVRVQITLASLAGDGAIEACDSILVPFELLALSGALSGRDIPPWESTIEEVEQAARQGRTLEWILKGSNVDERAMVVLSQMLLQVHDVHKIQKVSFTPAAPGQIALNLVVREKDADPYPGTWKAMPFRLNLGDGETGNNFAIRIQFAKPLTDEEGEEVSGELDSWAIGLATGAYGVAPVAPDRCTAFTDDDPVLLENTLEWGVSRFRAHPSAINGLVNVCASISHKIAKIEELIVES